MSYVDPKTVLAPQRYISKVKVVYDGGKGSWSLARLLWEGNWVTGMRWNGSDEDSVGNPQSHGRPTWFMVPEQLAPAVHAQAEELSRGKNEEMLAGYRAMAADEGREGEAMEWSEGLIGDAGDSTR